MCILTIACSHLDWDQWSFFVGNMWISNENRAETTTIQELKSTDDKPALVEQWFNLLVGFTGCCDDDYGLQYVNWMDSNLDLSSSWL